MKWISVKDKLPEKLYNSSFSENVIVFDCVLGKLSISMSTAIYNYKTNSWQGYDGKEHFYNEYITHWTSLPEPPEIKNDKTK